MSKRDYYDVLGVSSRADDAELKRAFRDKARACHPDLNPDSATAERKFKELNEAYAVLSDSKLRTRYDKLGHAGLDEENLSGITVVMETLDEFFGDLGRKWKERFKRKRGKDLRYTLEVDFVDAMKGCSRSIEVETARGSTKTFNVKIPAGTESGAVETIRGEGSAGVSGGPPGDLAVVIRVAAHDNMEKDGFNITSEADITFVEAILGDIVEVDTIDGPVRMKIPPGTQSGRTFRIRARGISKSGMPGQRGDHLVTVNVVLPARVTAKQEQLLRAFAEEDNAPLGKTGKRGIVNKLRSILDD